jgi:hypothetical protein
MSGGSYNYTYCRVDEEYVGRMYDAEMDDMMKDLVKVLHDLEWWQSCDTDEESYRKSLKSFKRKWFKGDRNARLEKIIDEKVEALRKELKEMM